MAICLLDVFAILFLISLTSSFLLWRWTKDFLMNKDLVRVPLKNKPPHPHSRHFSKRLYPWRWEIQFLILSQRGFILPQSALLSSLFDRYFVAHNCEDARMVAPPISSPLILTPSGLQYEYSDVCPHTSFYPSLPNRIVNIWPLMKAIPSSPCCAHKIIRGRLLCELAEHLTLPLPERHRTLRHTSILFLQRFTTIRERCLHLPYSSVLFQSLFGFETRTRTPRADVSKTF